MKNNKQPTFGNGKICYLEIPSNDISNSATFYKTVFGWYIRQNEDGSLSFDDSVGEVSGMWVLDRKPTTEVGILISIMVSNISLALELIKENGGSILQVETVKTAVFSDPTGNVFCLYESSRA
jgi:uncharacterized protein